MEPLELTITISWSENEEGWMYDIYHGTPDEIVAGLDSIDGGCCTGSMSDALEMAMSQTMIDTKDDEALDTRLEKGER